jgi:hypothetical protein
VLYFSKLSQWIILIITVSALTSCALIKNDNLSHDFYQLQPLPNILKNKVFLESLTFEQEDKRTLLSQIETQEQTLSLGAMTFSGIPIIQAKWDSSEGLVGFSSVTFDESMVLRIIRDIQLIKWPEKDIKSGLLPRYSLSTKQNSNIEKVREIKNAGKPIVTIIYTKQKTILINAIEHYQLTIEPVNE